MIVGSINEAWEYVRNLVPESFDLDRGASYELGYPVYKPRSNMNGDDSVKIRVDRLEVCINGEVEEIKIASYSTVTLTEIERIAIYKMLDSARSSILYWKDNLKQGNIDMAEFYKGILDKLEVEC